MRLIDADFLIDYWEPDVGRRFVADNFLWTVELAPTIDAVPVVRCRDCKYFDTMSSNDFNIPYCREWLSVTAKNGYCHKAEKEEGEGEE